MIDGRSNNLADLAALGLPRKEYPKKYDFGYCNSRIRHGEISF